MSRGAVLALRGAGGGRCEHRGLLEGDKRTADDYTRQKYGFVKVVVVVGLGSGGEVSQRRVVGRCRRSDQDRPECWGDSSCYSA